METPKAGWSGSVVRANVYWSRGLALKIEFSPADPARIAGGKPQKPFISSFLLVDIARYAIYCVIQSSR